MFGLSSVSWTAFLTFIAMLLCLYNLGIMAYFKLKKGDEKEKKSTQRAAKFKQTNVEQLQESIDDFLV